MPKIYKNNDTKFLVHHAETYEDLVEANKFAGDKHRTYETSRQVVILTLRGWQSLDLGDYIVHVPGSVYNPIELEHRVKETFTTPGFLIFGPKNFKKYFERVM